MANVKESDVTIRVRVGDSEIEVTGPKSYVEKKIDEFLKKPYVAAGTTGPAPAAIPVGQTDPLVKKLSPAQFFNKCNPKTDNERVLLGGFYLEQFGKFQNFTAAEVRDQIREAKRQPPKNVNDAVNQNIKKGLLMSAGDRENKRVFVLTSDGEEEVKEMLKEGNA